MKDQPEGDKMAEENSDTHTLTSQINLIKEQKQQSNTKLSQINDVNTTNNNCGDISKKKSKDILEEQFQGQQRKQSHGDNKSMTSSSLSEDQQNNLNENLKSDQSSACNSSVCSNSKDCRENVHKQQKVQSQSQIYMNQSQSSESNSSSYVIQKIKNQIGNINLSCSSEYQDEISPQNAKNNSNFLPQSIQASQNRKRLSEGNASFQKTAQNTNPLNANKFHFNKENYFGILGSPKKDDTDQQNVQTAIEQYNRFTESINQDSNIRLNQPESIPIMQNIKPTTSSQDLLGIIFCKNPQQLPFSLNIPQSITKFWPKESCISTEKLDTLGGLEKTINEKFINQRKDSSSQNSSDNLTTQHQSNNEYSNYPTSVSSSSSSNTQQMISNNNQHYTSFVKKQQQLQANSTSIQPLNISNQQNLMKSPSSLLKKENSEQKQNSQLNQLRSVYEQLAAQNQSGQSGNQNGVVMGGLNNNSALNQITNLINQTSYSLQNNNQSGQQLPNINNGQINLIPNSSGSISSSTNNNNNKKNRICNCKKTKCLKLYCDCFAVGELCGQDCKCLECCNNDATLHLRNQAILGILERNPFAFNVKPDEVKKLKKEQSNGPQNSASKVVGCNCRKSNCLKKYCLCYQSGLKCSEVCKCTECKNLENGLNSSSHSLCSSTINQNQNLSAGINSVTHSHPQHQAPQTLYNQHLQSLHNSESRRNSQNTNPNNNPIQKILDSLAIAAQQKQHHQQGFFNGQIQQQYLQHEDDEDDNEIHQNHQHHPMQNHNNQALNAYNNMFLNAISQFSLNLQDPNLTNGLSSSPTFSHLSQQATRKKLFLNDSGQTTPVSPGGLPLQNQQSHLSGQNINNIFSLIKNISTDQYQ